MARDERFPDEIGIDRRTFMKAAVGFGAAGLTGALVASGKSLMPPPRELEGEVNEGFVFAKGDSPNPFGFDAFAGEEARPEHFLDRDWMGAATLWRAIFDARGEQIPGTGFPVLLIRVNSDLFTHPEAWVPGRDFIDSPTIVAIWDRCVHLCCFPQWHLERLPSAYQDYEAGRVPRTTIDGEDPIWCRCHNSQYDPVTFVWDKHPNGTLYVGANLAHGPATRALAGVSIEEEGGVIRGTKFLTDAPQPPPDVVSGLGGKAGRIFRDWYFAYCR